MLPLASEYLSRIKDSVADQSAFGRLSQWITRHTTLHGQRWSFKEHEFQIDIIDERHPNVVVAKPSQVGMSEVTTRLMLAFLAVTPGANAIYLMPTVQEALRFSKSRVDPVILTSPFLRDSVSPGSDSSSFKQIGTSQVFFQGTFGKAVISIPCDLVVVDEISFCNVENVATAESRLSHSRFYFPDLNLRGIRRKFSTPTAPGMGISLYYEQSDRRLRLVKCKHCGHWFWPDYLYHCVVQGFDLPFDQMTFSDAQALDSKGLIDTAKLLCEKCHNPITPSNLGPEYREWVAQSPHVTHTRGYKVSPFDLPTFHTPTSLLRKRLEYKDEEGHFRNFTLGQEYADATNSILPNAVWENAIIPPEYPSSKKQGSYVAGLDVGKTSWLLIGRVTTVGIELVWAEQIRVDETGANLKDTLIRRIKEYNVIRMGCDSLPYTPTILEVKHSFPEGMVAPVLYTLTDRNLPAYQIVAQDNSIRANRTKTLDSLVRKVNAGQVKFPQNHLELETIANHLQGMKRVDRLNSVQEWEADWVKTGPDHYFHALNYLMIAAESVLSGLALPIWSASTSIKQAKVGSRFTPQERDTNPHLIT